MGTSKLSAVIFERYLGFLARLVILRKIQVMQLETWRHQSWFRLYRAQTIKAMDDSCDNQVCASSNAPSGTLCHSIQCIDTQHIFSHPPK